MQQFQDRINSFSLMDLGPIGYKYTCGGLIAHGGIIVFEKLDRALSNDIWRNMFSEAHVQVLHRLEYSDHHPIFICLQDKDLSKRNRDFRFESAWLVDKSFERFIKEAWNNIVHLIGNMKALKEQVVQWNLHNLKSINKEKNRLLPY